MPDDGIDILGVLSDDELTAELLAAKTLVASSLGGETFGMVLTRALACAVPVVASDIPGYRAVVDPDIGVLVPPGDHDALAAAVVDLLADEPRRQRRGLGGPRARPAPLRVGTHRGAAARDLRGRRRARAGERLMVAFARSPWVRMSFVVLSAAAVFALFWWRGPSWSAVGDAFTLVSWRWVLAAIGLNLLSVVARSIAWKVVIDQALPPPTPKFGLVFAAFSVGLFANAVLPGRIGELARVAVLNRKLPPRKGTWATLVGTVFAHRVFDLVPVLFLIVFVLLTAKIPHWAASSLAAFVGVGVALLAFSIAVARHQKRSALDELGAGEADRLDGAPGAERDALAARRGDRDPVPVRRLVLPAARRLGDDRPRSTCTCRSQAAALVLVLMNVATVFPLWPGNVGLLQAAIAIPLKRYGVGYALGFAFGIGLQAIEASVGIGVGLIFLAQRGPVVRDAARDARRVAGRDVRSGER